MSRTDGYIPLLAGTVPVANTVTIEPPAETAELIAAVETLRTAGPDSAWEPVHAALRATPRLWVETTAAAEPDVVVVQREGMAWIPVFTTVLRLVDWKNRCGQGETPVRYAGISGADLLATLPRMPNGTGLVLDPGSEHVTALPLPDAVEGC
ncbi:SseB family protein [Saccharopolyspora griseoalba]|uniref:SseB family protein n=1 Tax=Saccharopolyspora griseoalba TaxID=1431848 RepID=A0ABW2LPT2_9PSEU